MANQLRHTHTHTNQIEFGWTAPRGHQTRDTKRGNQTGGTKCSTKQKADRRTRFKQRLIVLRLFCELHSMKSFRGTELHNLYLNVIQRRLDGLNYTISYPNVIQSRLDRLNYANDSLNSIQRPLDRRNNHAFTDVTAKPKSEPARIFAELIDIPTVQTTMQQMCVGLAKRSVMQPVWVWTPVRNSNVALNPCVYPLPLNMSFWCL
jgi:hypothetical protein